MKKRKAKIKIKISVKKTNMGINSSCTNSSHILHGDVFGFLCWYILLFRAPYKAFMQPSFCLHALLS